MPHITLKLLGLIAVFCVSTAGVYPVAQAQENPVGDTPEDTQKLEFDSEDITLEEGYNIEPVVINLSVPTTAIFDGTDLLVAESGYLGTAEPRVLRISPEGTVTVEASEGLLAPVTGLLVIGDEMYVSHKTKVSVIQEDGSLEDIVTDLPSLGDHHNNQIVLGPDGKIYMGQGVVTNSAVVGVDNYVFGWLEDYPAVHEIPCEDITVTGENFTSENPLTPENDDVVTTGPYKPFGIPVTAGEIIPGNEKCGGSIVRFNPDGSEFEVVAWGLRNPFGLEFDATGQLWATNHGVDVRGSRPVNNDTDYLLDIQEGAWYGWPDYFEGRTVESAEFVAPGQPAAKALLIDPPELTQPFLTFESHAATNGVDFAPAEFGYEGDAFIAEFGTFAPLTSGLNIKPVGYKVTRVDMETKDITTFASNQLPGPAYINQQGGFNRPSDVVFGPDDSLYVVDWGSAELTTEGLELVPESGAIWRIYPEAQTALRPDGPVAVASALTSEEEKKPIVPNIPETYKQVLPQWLWLIAGIIIVVIILVALIAWWSKQKTDTPVRRSRR